MNKLCIISITVLLVVMLTPVSSSVAGNPNFRIDSNRDGQLIEITVKEVQKGLDINRKAERHIEKAKQWFECGWTKVSNYHSHMALIELLREQNGLLRQQIKLLKDLKRPYVLKEE